SVLDCATVLPSRNLSHVPWCDYSLAHTAPSCASGRASCDQNRFVATARSTNSCVIWVRQHGILVCHCAWELRDVSIHRVGRFLRQDLSSTDDTAIRGVSTHRPCQC